MSDQIQVDEVQALRAELDRLAGALYDMDAILARNFVNGEIAGFRFDGAQGIDTVLDDQGGDALAYGLYNNTDVPVTIATAAMGLQVPARFLVVAPITINGHVQLVADPEALGEKAVSVLRWRFPTPQPFFVGKLA